MIGKAISHYKILEKLGEGGMGIIYKAEDTKLDRIVALKFLPSHLTANDTDKVRFIQEAKAAAAINHPNVCTIFDIQEHDGQQFIVMEYVEGQTLRDKIKNERLKIKDAIDYATQIAEALKAAHSKDIIHRDIKSENIMVTSTGQIKIMDFGLAKLRGSVKLTKTFTTAGTLSYSSPEQIQGKAVDARSDIFSFGVVLYEMLTGHLPFNGEYESAIIYSIMNEEPESLSAIKSDIPPDLVLLNERMLAKEILDRPESCAQIQSELLKLNVASHEEIQQKKAIAILPFTDMSQANDQEYFCDGIAEEIINALTHIRNLRIIARTSAFSFKNKNMDVREIGRKLQVKYLLEGSVRRAGETLRITAQLIDVADGSHIWSERYDRKLIDVFGIQDEIAVKIVEKMRVSFKKGERDLLTRHYTEDTEAYNLYLYGRFYWNRLTENGFKKGIQYFQKAINRDPAFALSYAGIAHSYFFLGWYYYMEPVEAFPKAREAALTALKMDEKLSEAQSILASIRMIFDREWEAAENAFQLAIMQNPGYSDAHIFYSFYLAAQARHDESISEAEKGLNLDPLTLFPGLNLGIRLYYARQYDHSLEKMKDAVDLNPHIEIGHLYICFPLIMKGLYDEAFTEINKAIELIGRDQSEILATLGIIEILMGNIKEGEIILDELFELFKQKRVSYFFMAIIYSLLNRKDEAFEWLKNGLKNHDHLMIFTQVEPMLDNLRSDPRYIELLTKIGLQE
jgi:serine/threonine protein kinase/Tfp pilus assembly protein PilF